VSVGGSPRSNLILPDGVSYPEAAPDQVVIDNRTELPDGVVQEAVKDMFVEHASMAGIERSTFQTYANEGSMLARRKYQTPANVIDEIKLARDLAERDDDVAAVIGEMIATAFGDGLEQQGEDEATVAIFSQMARQKYMGLEGAFQEMYRELLISSQVNTAILFTRENIDYTLQGSPRRLRKSVAVPLIGVLHAENIRVIGNDTFRTGRLAYIPDNDQLMKWLREFYGERTSPARKAQMGREDRVSANLFTGPAPPSALKDDPVFDSRFGGAEMYFLNERMVHRSTFAKGEWKYPRPLLTRDFSLLEAKRLLNIMDYALLQGGSNFIVVAKKGTDERPASKEEVENLQQVVRVASKTGVIVGDHRLSFEVITPNMDALLNPDKRRLVGRKIVQGMLRISESAQEERVASSGTNPELESKARIITSDRKLLQRHVEDYVYPEIVNRNPIFRDAPHIAFPKIVLQGTQFFTDYMLKLRDRGDIPRKWAVEYAGFDFDAAVEQRKRELEAGVDEVMMPAEVPFSSPGSPQDNGPGRPKGAGDNPTPGTPEVRPPGEPRQLLQRNPGETIRSWYDEDMDMVCRMGDITYAILDQFPDRQIGRITPTERSVIGAIGEEAERRGSTLYVPVNPGYAQVTDLKAVRLDQGLSVIVGSLPNGAIVAKLLCFRDMEFSQDEAEDVALQWGFPVKMPVPAIEQTAAVAQPPIILLTQGEGAKPMKRIIERDASGEIIGSRDEPIDSED
jgi:hypothetical protein